MSGSTTSLSIVKELRRLAQNPAHREYLLRNDVNSILIFVDPDEHPVEVVTEALNALLYLAEEASENHLTKRSMRGTIGLLELMKKVEDREGYAIDCKAIAIRIQHLLNNRSEQSTYSNKENKKQPQQAESGVLTRAGGVASTRKTKESVHFLGGNKKAKVVTLQIKGLIDQERRQICADQLVRVKGVISLTFNMHLQRCTIRTKAELTAEILASAVRKTEVMDALQVLKDADGKEILVPLESKIDDKDDKELPPYLEEDAGDSPLRDDKAVARPGSGGTFGSFASSWFGGMLNAVNKNLYW